MVKKVLSLIFLVVLLTFVVSGCGVEKDDLDSSIEKLKNITDGVEKELKDNLRSDENKESTNEDIDQESGEEDNAETTVEVQKRWPEKGYESIPRFEKGKCVWLSDYTNYFSAVYEGVTEKELKSYQQLLLDAGYELKNESGNTFNYMLGEAKSLVGLVYEDKMLTISGSGN